MSFLPNSPIYTEPGASAFNVSASGWIVDPTTNTNGTNLQTIYLASGASAGAKVLYGNNTGTPTNNDPIMRCEASSESGALQNIRVPAGFGIYYVHVAGSSAVGTYTAL